MPGRHLISHPVLDAIRIEAFEPLGWFEPEPGDGVPGEARFAVLIGNAGPAMFRRFARERDPATDSLDEWCRTVLGRLADELGAATCFPFDVPPLPFSVWGRKARAGHASPLGLNIHPEFGLWHAYRALFAFPRPLDLLQLPNLPAPCAACLDKPCLTTCPVGAFSEAGYDVSRCVSYIETPDGRDCIDFGCRARRACPVGGAYAYAPSQAAFHMSAFVRARTETRR